MHNYIYLLQLRVIVLQTERVQHQVDHEEAAGAGAQRQRHIGATDPQHYRRRVNLFNLLTQIMSSYTVTEISWLSV